MLLQVVGVEGVDLDLDQLAVPGDELRRAGVAGLAGVGRQVVVDHLLAVECDPDDVVPALGCSTRSRSMSSPDGSKSPANSSTAFRPSRATSCAITST
jgi:hypothetical protein